MSLRSRVTRLIPQGEFRRGALMIAGGTGIAQLVAILASPIVTRLYAPADYGAYAVAASIVIVLGSIACLRYDYAIPLPGSDGEAANVLGLCVLVSAAIALASLLVLLAAAPWIGAALGESSVGGVVLLVPIGVLLSGLLAALTAWMIRSRAYPEIATSRFAQSATTTTLQVGLGLLRGGTTALLIALAVGMTAGTARVGRAAWSRSATAFREVTRSGMRAAAARYRRFPIFSAPSTFLNNIGLEAPLLLVVALYGTHVGGQLALAQRIVALPIGIVANAVGQVFFAEASRLAREQPSALRPLFARTTRTLALTAIGPFILGAIAAPLLFGLVFGQTWAEAGTFVAILAPMYFLQFVATPTGGTLDILERQDLHLVRELGRLLLIGGAVAVGAILRLPPLSTIVLVSVAGSATNILYGLLSYRALAGYEASGSAPGPVLDPPPTDPPA